MELRQLQFLILLVLHELEHILESANFGHKYNLVDVSTIVLSWPWFVSSHQNNNSYSSSNNNNNNINMSLFVWRTQYITLLCQTLLTRLFLSLNIKNSKEKIEMSLIFDFFKWFLLVLNIEYNKDKYIFLIWSKFHFHFMYWILSFNFVVSLSHFLSFLTPVELCWYILIDWIYVNSRNLLCLCIIM